MNESEDCTGISWADSKQYMFWRRCQQCLACITAEAANQRETWQWCVYHSSSVECPGELPTPSSYAVVAERLLRATIRENYLVTEWRVVRGWPGGVDFSMPVRAVGGELRWVHVEVDGETHTTKGWEASTAQQQQARDREKDALAWEPHACPASPPGSIGVVTLSQGCSIPSSTAVPGALHFLHTSLCPAATGKQVGAHAKVRALTKYGLPSHPVLVCRKPKKTVPT